MFVDPATLRVAAAPRRQAILRLVWDAERSAGEIHSALGDVTFGAVSQHLGVLEENGLVVRRVEGRQRFYRAVPEALGPLRAWLEDMWADALYDLKLRAELEEARRGPHPKQRRKSKTKASTRTKENP
jgi:DNA-binding transcriptional ArsR family regulator